MRRRPGIDPLPPVAVGVAMPWDAPVGDAVATLAAARARLGDTFVVDSGEDRWLLTFSPAGVDSFYALPEEVASKGVADYLMLRRKLPDELFHDRRLLPGDLFGVGDAPAYLAHLDTALDRTLVELGAAGTVDVFDLTRRVAHRMGLASWAGPGSDEAPAVDALVEALDALDGAESFVHPDRMAAVAASGHAAEWAALAVVEEHVGAALDRHDAGEGGPGLFARVVAAWDGEPDDVRRRGVARDVTLIHLASMSNLAAALGWLLVDVLARPDAVARVRSGEEGFAEAAARESTRLAQRSIMTRAVLRPTTVDVGADGGGVLALDPGVLVATLLPLTNAPSELGLDTWDPARWHRHRFTATEGLASPRLVTAFGHGRHTCPAQPFAVIAMATALRRLVTALDLEPGWIAPRPVPAQVGGVARAVAPCPVVYRRRPS